MNPNVEQHKARMAALNDQRNKEREKGKSVTRHIIMQLDERFEQTLTNAPGAIIPYEPARPRMPAPTTSSRKGVYRVNGSIRIMAGG